MSLRPKATEATEEAERRLSRLSLVLAAGEAERLRQQETADIDGRFDDMKKIVKSRDRYALKDNVVKAVKNEAQRRSDSAHYNSYGVRLGAVMRVKTEQLREDVAGLSPQERAAFRQRFIEEYLQDYRDGFEDYLTQVLKPGGTLVNSVRHPLDFGVGHLHGWVQFARLRRAQRPADMREEEWAAYRARLIKDDMLRGFAVKAWLELLDRDILNVDKWAALASNVRWDAFCNEIADRLAYQYKAVMHRFCKEEIARTANMIDSNGVIAESYAGALRRNNFMWADRSQTPQLLVPYKFPVDHRGAGDDNDARMKFVEFKWNNQPGGYNDYNLGRWTTLGTISPPFDHHEMESYLKALVPDVYKRFMPELDADFELLKLMHDTRELRNPQRLFWYLHSSGLAKLDVIDAYSIPQDTVLRDRAVAGGELRFYTGEPHWQHGTFEDYKRGDERNIGQYTTLIRAVKRRPRDGDE